MKRFSDADRTYTNQSDGKTFYGYDDNGRTEWYDEKGNLDCITSYGGGTARNNDDDYENRRRRTRRR